MQYPDRVTVCVSTQAGCAMACQFCATGQAGFQRQLTQGEIVEQVAVAMREARPRRVSNVVFMGMGEPLANYDRVWGAVDRLHGDMGLSARHLTLSTVGIVPGIRRLATETLPVNLAVSLHAANDVAAGRAGAHQPALPARDAGRRLCRLRGGQRAPPLHRVGDDRRRQRPWRRRRSSWRSSPARWVPTSTSSRSTRRPGTAWSARRGDGCAASVTTWWRSG